MKEIVKNVLDRLNDVEAKLINARLLILVELSGHSVNQHAE